MKPLVAGNWKMHLDRAGARALANDLMRSLPAPLEAAEVAVFPPFTALAEVAAALSGGDITLGAQNFHPEDQGAFTGEVSLPMLLDVGVTRVLAGHSERRHVLGEDDAFVNRKVLAALKHDLLPILCVGEKLDEREAGKTAAVVERQVRAGLKGVGPERAGDVTVAYEPVWAIGTGLNATPKQAAEVHAQIRKLLVEILKEGGRGVRILYGGSVKPENSRELLKTPEVNGLLVGGASLKADSFVRIVRAAG
ncbi:MAG: triose-phosphate isomerase [Planctomycetes bacterium]|nr:triose-phosphate isomerase [Planctomycetota bacterium]